MRVIKSGKPWWVGMKVTCSGCAAELEIETRDSFQVYWKTATTEGARFHCPECSTEILIDRPRESATEALRLEHSAVRQERNIRSRK